MKSILLDSRRLAPLVCLFGGLVLAACDAQAPSESGTGAADMTVLALSSTDVANVTVTVTATALPSPRSLALYPRAGQWGALLGPLPAGNGYTFSAVATDAAGVILYTGSASNVTIVKDQTVAVVITAQQATPPDPYQNAVPVFDSLVVSSIAVAPGDTVSVAATAHDPNSQDTLSYQWSATCGSFTAPSQPSTTWTAPTVAGACALTIKVSDPHLATVTASVTVNVSSSSAKGQADVSVTANTWPSITDVSVAPNGWLATGTPSTLAVTASDDDHDPLTYAWASSCAGDFSSSTVANPTFTLSAGQTGTCTLTVAVSDGRGGLTTGDITLPIGAPVVHQGP